MAIIHRATLTPGKLELVAAWLPRQEWYDGPAEPSLEAVGAYRFDDPAGQVGIETLVVRTGTGTVLQVPLTYRAGPLPGAEDALLGTMAHSTLGQRWVHDGCADRVFTTALAGAILGTVRQAEELVQTGSGEQRREPTMWVTGSGGEAGPLDLDLRRELDLDAPAGGLTLTGTWAGQEQPVVLAAARRR